MINTNTSRPFYKRLLQILIGLLKNHTVVTLLIIFFTGAIIVLFPLKHLSDDLIISNALENARLYSNAISEFRSIYTSEVVLKMRKAGIEVTHDYEFKSNAIPLPATLSMILGKRIGEKGIGGETKLYSPYPFPWRKAEGGLSDQFSKDAWNTLKNNPDSEFYRVEELNGKMVLQYATADILRPACVGCHNSHPDSPRRGWKEGDVRGVLQISLPLSSIKSKGNTGIATTMAYTLSVTLVILLMLALIIRKLNHSMQEIEEQNKQREERGRELFSVIDQEKRKISANLHDNIGQILSAAMLSLTKLNLENEPLSKEKAAIRKNLDHLLKDAYLEIKNLSYSVLPEKLLSIGVVNAISELLAKIETISGLSVELDVKCDEKLLSDEIKSSVYSMTQEIMNNILKHSKATKVMVQLIQNDQSIILMIEDNGIGFDKNKIHETEKLGIKNLFARTLWLNGTIDIDTSPGNGTTIVIEFPL